MTPSALTSLLVVVILAPTLPGIANRIKSALTGRRGSPVLQLYADLWKLWRKGVVYSTTTTLIFRLAPVVLVSTTLLAACLLPWDSSSAVMSFPGDLVAFAGLLALGRFLLVLSAMDTGSSFEGMGASREVTIAAFTEPTLMLCFTGLVLATGQVSLQGMFGTPLAHTWSAAAPSVVLTGAGLLILSLAETCRVPVDDPLAHLELTMIHEVMVLDHSGPDLALILYASALKMAIFGGLVVRVLSAGAALPDSAALTVLVVGLVVYAVVIGVIESGMARLKMNRIPQLLVAASTVAGFGLILLLR